MYSSSLTLTLRLSHSTDPGSHKEGVGLTSTTSKKVSCNHLYFLTWVGRGGGGGGGWKQKASTHFSPKAPANGGLKDEKVESKEDIQIE